ncbi:beta-glucosidase, partial [Microbacterium sp. SUBG005]
YLDLLTEMRRLGIRPLVTLSHYDPPLALALKNNAVGGPRDHRPIRAVLAHLLRAVRAPRRPLAVVQRDRRDHPPPFTSGGIVDETVEGSLEQACYTALHHQFVASASVTKTLHELWPASEMGCMLTMLTTYPNTCHPDDVAAT